MLSTTVIVAMVRAKGEDFKWSGQKVDRTATDVGLSLMGEA